jgi:hypothetical protein
VESIRAVGSLVVAGRYPSCVPASCVPRPRHHLAAFTEPASSCPWPVLWHAADDDSCHVRGLVIGLRDKACGYWQYPRPGGGS